MPDPVDTPVAAPTPPPPADQPSPAFQDLIDTYLNPGLADRDPVLDRPLNAPPPAQPAATSPPPPPPPPPPPATHSHSKLLLAELAPLGLPADVVAETPSAELWEYLRTVRAAAPAQRAEPEPKAAAAADPDSLLEQRREHLLEQGYDEGLIDLLGQIERAGAAKVKALEDQLGQLRQAEQVRQAESQFARIDRLFAGLGPEYEAVFGKGGREDLDPAGGEMARRQAVLVTAQQLAGGRGDFGAALATAARTLFGQMAQAAPAAPAAPATAETPAAPARRRNPDGTFADRVEEWERAAGDARPTNRKGAPEPKGDAAAARAIAERAHAMYAAAPGQYVNGTARLDDFPD